MFAFKTTHSASRQSSSKQCQYDIWTIVLNLLREARHDVGNRPHSFAVPALCHTHISHKGNTRDVQYAVHRFIPP